MRLMSLIATSGAVLLAGALAVTPTAGAGAADSSDAPDPTATAAVTLDGTSPGRTFDGVGAVSSGGSSRLLLDYPRRERNQILDYLFKPDYGASLQILKVEIGGDTDATDGSEPSIERTRGAVDCDRGYEWWLMAQAQKRNPDIEFYGLEWGAPGWVGSRWSTDNVNYEVAWLGCAKQHGFHIDYLGGANESGYDKTYYEKLHQAVRGAGYDAKIVASDDHNPPNYWQVATDMKNDPAFDDAVDVVGEHDVCVWRTLYQHCNVSDDALALGKPLFNSETSTESFDVGPASLARAMNRDYVDARLTGDLDWALLSAWYADFPIADTGLLEADQPWSGYYRLGPSIWVDAHTTQFAQPGWRYLDDSSGYLDDGASYVTLRSDSGDYSTVVETMDATAPVTVTFSVTGGLSQVPVQEWSTDLGTTTMHDDFVHVRDLPVNDGSYSVTLAPGHVYTLSTLRSAHKGHSASHADPAAQLPLPYSEDFEDVGSTNLARYFSDNNGGFEAVPCGGGRTGTCYQQQVTQAPVSWHGTAERPASLVGDPSWWGDYEVGVDAMLDQPGAVQLIGRAESQQHRVASYRLQFADSGDWQLYTEDVDGKDTTLAKGTNTFGMNAWHRLGLRFHGDTITALLDGQALATVTDQSHTSGQVGIATGGWQRAEFDNLSVVPTGPAPKFVPHVDMTATASSAHVTNDFGDSYGVSRAIDDRPESYWRSEYDPATPLPQSITLDLHRLRTVRALTYKPPLASASTGTILGYQVSLSRDGQSFQQVAEGTWDPTVATKVASWTGSPEARYVRLTAVSTTGCPSTASVAELNASVTAITDYPTSGDRGTGQAPAPAQFDHVVSDSELTATASSHHVGYEPANAVDGNCATFWHTEWTPLDTAPQQLTIDLAQPHSLDGLSYQPRQDGNTNGVVTQYRVELSDDGTTWHSVATGSWPLDATTKYVTWPAETASHVRLVVLAGGGGYASAAEVTLADVPPN